jgi:hypothetical protein
LAGIIVDSPQKQEENIFMIALQLHKINCNNAAKPASVIETSLGSGL